MRQCGHCDADISDRPKNSRYCTGDECHLARMRAHGRTSYRRHQPERREQQNAAYALKAATRVKPLRSCAHCGADISHRGGRARWCDMGCREKARHRANPSRARHRAATRRAAPGTGLTGERWFAMLRRYVGRCAYCGGQSERLTQDHVIPLSRGGHDTEGNIVPACAPCNSRKGDRLLAEWRHGWKGKRPGALGRVPGVRRPKRTYSRS